MSKKIILSVAIISLFAPYLVSAGNHATHIPFWGGTDQGQHGLLSCSGPLYLQDPTDPTKFTENTNACKSFCDFIDTGVNIVYFVMTIGLFILVPIFFAWGGIMIMLSGPNPGSRETGKKMLTGAVIGAVIILLAFVIIKVVVDLLGVGLPGVSGPFNCVPPS